MATVYGLTDQGFFVKTLEVILDGIAADLREEFGASYDLSPDTIEGVVFSIVADIAAELWELGQAIYSAGDPNSATGAALAALAALTGTVKEPASKSTVVAALTGNDGTLVPSGSQASTGSTTTRFETIDDATIVAVDAWAPSTPYSQLQRVTSGSHVFQCIGAGISGVVALHTLAPLDVTSTSITDNTVTWTYLGPGVGAVDSDAVAIETGPTFVGVNDLTVIDTPVSGWLGVNNMATANVGRHEMTDPELRISRVIGLRDPGTGPVGALRAAMRKVAGVSAVTVFHNLTSTTDADGLPPHSVEVLITGGDDDDIAAKLWESVSAGIGTHGTTMVVYTDDEGTDHEMRFSRPVEVDVWVDLDVVVDPDEFPIDGVDQIKDAIIDWSEDQKTGRDVVPMALVAQAFKVPGVLNVPSVLVGTSDPPVGTAVIPISLRERASYAGTRISVTTTNGVP